MSVSWAVEARKLHYIDGYTYKQIADHFDRSVSRVHRVITGSQAPRPPRLRPPDTPENKHRRNLRRWCRRNAPRLGKSVKALYIEHGVEDLDRVALWEQRK